MAEYALKKEYTGILNIKKRSGDDFTLEAKEKIKDQIKGQTVDMCGTGYVIVDSWIDGEDIWYKAVVKEVDKEKLEEEENAFWDKYVRINHFK